MEERGRNIKKAGRGRGEEENREGRTGGKGRENREGMRKKRRNRKLKKIWREIQRNEGEKGK